VNAVNDAPTFTINRDVTVFKNFTTIEVVNVIPAPVPSDEAAQVVRYSLNPASVSFAAISFNDTTGMVTITSIQDMIGSQVFTITADDGQAVNNLYSQPFTLTVVDTNYQPTLDAIADPAPIDEDAGMQTINLSGITPGFNELQPVTVSAISDNPALIPHPVVSYSNPDSTGMLNYAPAANQHGSARITVTVDDGRATNNTISRTFTVIVNPVNDEPTLNAISDITVAEDDGMQTVTLSGISAGPNENDLLSITASSSNASLIANPTVIYNNPNSTGMLRFAPAANQNGTSVITIIVNDGQSINNIIIRTFTVSVTPVNDAPLITDVHKVGQEDKSIGFAASNFITQYSDIENDPMAKIQIRSLPMNGVLMLNGTALNLMDEVAAGDISQMIYTPLPEFSGADSFAWNGSDGQLYAVMNAMVYLNLNQVNDKPFVISHIPDITANEDDAPLTNYVNLDNIFGDVESTGGMVYSVTMNSNASLVKILIDTDNTLDITLGADAHGIAVIVIQAQDQGGSVATDTFGVTVNSVEDAPGIFNLLTPENNSVISEPSLINFSWENSRDADGDAVTYAITIRGFQLDTTISVSSATSIALDGSSLFAANVPYAWFVTASDGDDVTTSPAFAFRISTTAINDVNLMTGPVEAYPNPFMDKTRITYSLKTEAAVKLMILNFLGQHLETIAEEEQAKGEHSFEWNGTNAVPGLYFYELFIKSESGVQASFIGRLVKD